MRRDMFAWLLRGPDRPGAPHRDFGGGSMPPEYGEEGGTSLWNGKRRHGQPPRSNSESVRLWRLLGGRDFVRSPRNSVWPLARFNGSHAAKIDCHRANFHVRSAPSKQLPLIAKLDSKTAFAPQKERPSGTSFGCLYMLTGC